MKKIGMIFMLVAILGWVGCKNDVKEEELSGNEELRLSDTEIEKLRSLALSGDPNAAKKLWHHYSFVELNYKEGEKWKIVYERAGASGGLEDNRSN
jgi:hypothetical protein